MRYRIEQYTYDDAVRIVARHFVAIVPREVAERFEQLVRRARPRGWWQMQLLLTLAEVGRAPASAARIVRGRAAAYTGRYQRSLDEVMGRVGARYVPGPRGGRWAAYYELRDGE